MSSAPALIATSGDSLREAFGKALSGMADEFSNVVVLDADIAGGTGRLREPAAGVADRAMRRRLAVMREIGEQPRDRVGHRTLAVRPLATALRDAGAGEAETLFRLARGLRRLRKHGAHDPRRVGEGDRAVGTNRAEQQRAFLAASLQVRRQQMLVLRARSEEDKRSKPMTIMDVSDAAVREALRAHDCTRLIHGHTHRPARHRLEVDGRECERWVLPDWYRRGGFLEVNASGARLVNLPLA